MSATPALLQGTGKHPRHREEWETSSEEEDAEGVAGSSQEPRHRALMKKRRKKAVAPSGPVSGIPGLEPEDIRCPYLDTINRSLLDFDFEKLCSVTLANNNVYACLVCGKYFQGRGKSTPANFHALECSHYVFMNLHSGKFFCIPDNYEIKDSSLQDIVYNWNPQYTKEQIQQLDQGTRKSRGVEGEDFIPGTIAINTLTDTSYINCVIQSLSKVVPMRNFLLQPQNYEDKCRSGPNAVLISRFGELLRKIWNPRNFRGHVSPHEFVQAVSDASDKQYRIGKRADALDFLRWFLNVSSATLRAGGVTMNSSASSASSSNAGPSQGGAPTIIEYAFQGKVRVTSTRFKVEGIKVEGPKDVGLNLGQMKEERKQENKILKQKTKTNPFIILTLDLPAAPLFKDANDRNFIPQIPLFSILQKFDGKTFTDVAVGAGTLERRTYQLTRLPRYLILHIKRFSKNEFFIEKNPTIVNFPIRNLDMRPYVDLPASMVGKVSTKYDLVANICHVDGNTPFEGEYKVQVHHKSTDQWYEIEDLEVNAILPQQVALSESYIQIYERKPLQTGSSSASGSASSTTSASSSSSGVKMEVDAS